MKKTADRRLAMWEKSRDIGEEILRGIRDIKAGRIGRSFTVDSFAVGPVRATSPGSPKGQRRRGKRSYEQEDQIHGRTARKTQGRS